MDYLSSGRNRQAADTLLDQPALVQKVGSDNANDCAFRKDWNGFVPSCCRWTIQHLERFLLLPDALF
jgi:hypothetical protein